MSFLMAPAPSRREFQSSWEVICPATMFLRVWQVAPRKILDSESRYPHVISWCNTTLGSASSGKDS